MPSDLSSLRAVPFVGRASDLEAIARWFDEGARVVTLVGPGGAGKSALAAEHAVRRVASGDRAGAILCEVGAARAAIDPRAALRDAMAVALAIEPGRRSAEPEGDDARIGAALAARGDVVVVIDDFEGLVEHAADSIGAWSSAAPEAEIVVTSRERLAITGEVVHEVGPMDADGVALLVAAAAKRAAGFALREDDVADARRVVAALDGLPLALDMAGARLPLVGARGVLAEVQASLESLRRDVRGGPARHATLEAAVRGSFDALAERDREVLAQLTVFRGGFTAESVAGVIEPGAGETAVASLARLRDRSLVRMRDAPSARFDLFASVRAFAARQRPASVAAAAERHAAWFAMRATEAAESAHRDRRARAWLAAERENLLAIAERVVASDAAPSARAAELALRAIVASYPLLLSSRRPLGALAAAVTPVVERTRDSGAEPALAARALLLRGALRREAKNVRAALKDLLAAESIAKGLADALLEADAQVELGRTLLIAKEGEAARRQLEKAAVAFGRMGARAREAHALAWRARAHREAGEADAASRRAWLERAAGLANGEDGLAGWVLLELGEELALSRGAPRSAPASSAPHASAKSALSEAIVLAVRERDALLEAEARARLGAVLLEEAELAEKTAIDAAERELVAARDAFEVQGLELEAAVVRGRLGLVARARGREGEACALFADARDAALRADCKEEAARWAELLEPIEPPPGSPRPPRSARLAADALVVGESGAWFRPPNGARVGLERRRNLARILDRLAAAHEAAKGLAGAVAPISSGQLFEVAWPGEKALPHAAAHRVRVAVATLRKMGLAEAILTTPTGYALAAHTTVVRA
ncbi:MAG: hypothetical protein JST00_19645 [Deltaproteobacteria bacterium]|nr:hypothetical protein [Deltaproteobacteria bacterium]